MDVTVLVVPDCPHATPVARLLAEILAEEGYGHLSVGIEVIDDQERARASGFIGSPSFFFDGIDLFAVVLEVQPRGLRASTDQGSASAPSLTCLDASFLAHGRIKCEAHQ